MDVDRALGRAWRDGVPWELLTHLCELDDRLGGHPGERHAAELVADALREAGVRDVTERAFEMQCWNRGSTAVSVELPDRDRERSFEALALPYSPGGDVTGELVDVGHGTPAELVDRDLTDRIVVASTGTPPGADRRSHRMEKAGSAAEAGAAAFVFTNHVPGQLPPTGALAFGHEGALPGVGVSRETGAWLREYAADGATARLRVEAETVPGESRNVVGHLGPETDREILLVAHLDAHDVAEGALDNGCGVATMLGAVRILAALEDDLDVRIRVAGLGCEELGLLGSEALADEVDLDRVVAVVNVDGAGRDRNLRAQTHHSEPLATIAEGVAERLDHPLTVDDVPHAYSDHWPFLRAGVPAVQFHSAAPGDDGHWERGWTHTRADTLDKADSRTIREHAMVIALVVRDLASDQSDPPRIDRDDLRERFVEAGDRPAMEAAGVWPDDW